MTLRLPLDRGDLLAAAHREGEVLDTTVTTTHVALRVVLDAGGRRAVRAVAGSARELRAAAVPLRAPRRAEEASPRATTADAIDCSIGTPVDPPPAMRHGRAGARRRGAGLSAVERIA